jgi:hypothetical protein
MDVEVGEGHGRHLCWEETQIVVDHIQVFKCLQKRDFWREIFEAVVSCPGKHT